MAIQHKIVELPPKRRGFHIITGTINEALSDWKEDGLLHLFIRHTSAGLCINEAADPDVLDDFESMFNYLVPENLDFLKHTVEGPDDMPAHIKSALVGHSLTVPVKNGKMMLGTWQGIYLCEFRNRARARSIVLSMMS